eukprot:CAMPEP_0172496614 /NCGR_PEP_ID=MMETSP1066-20121228/90098_1 /TAXON_ID=671091 /ORGANISM="Coscinodiscus wailesii, Strain CCMP2513" /LENGTH=689 /DNA_ID=CAMNT_0013268993 /DNA_START=143 /DNA_END=2209 /DNA_ORIENTATION=+
MSRSAAILLELLQGDEGVKWAQERNGWDSTTNECEWDGIECDSANRLTEINIEGTNLIATIPELFSQLPATLRHIFLADNKLHGTFPQSIASNLHNLVQLDVSSNYLRGDVPHFENSYLEVINLSHNQFSNKLKESTGVGLRRVRIFDVEGNRIGGTIPESMALMTNLMELNLSNNKLGGSIPDKLNKLQQLEGLFLSNNQLIGSIPELDIVPLKQIFVHGNALSGSLPSFLANLPALENLFIDNNKLTGTVPAKLCDKNLNERFFSAGVNKIDAVDVDDYFTSIDDDGIEDIDDDFEPDDEYGPDNRRNRQRQRRLVSWSDERNGKRRLDYNERRDGCNSVACPAGYYSTDETKVGIFPCAKCELDHINPYLGAKECHGLELHEILKSFYDGTSGQSWGEGSWVDDSVPICEKEGITCDSQQRIIEINLRGKDLSGTISEDLGYLQHLKSLVLADNSLYGTVPSTLHFLPLETLDISGNKLTGFVPPELCFKHGVNENGKNGILNCDIISCPVGKFSATGRADLGSDQKLKCMPCTVQEESVYLGSKICSGSSLKNAASRANLQATANKSLIFTAFFLFFVSGGIIFFLVQRSRAHRFAVQDIHQFDDDDDENDFENVWASGFNDSGGLGGPRGGASSEESSYSSNTSSTKGFPTTMLGETRPGEDGGGGGGNMEWKMQKPMGGDSIW